MVYLIHLTRTPAQLINTHTLAVATSLAMVVEELQLGFGQRSRTLLLAKPADGPKGWVVRSHHELKQRHLARGQKGS